MFVLKNRLRAWRAEMLARGALLPGEIAELEDHLAEEALRLAKEGKSDESAFAESLRRVGTTTELSEEFGKAHRLQGRTAASVFSTTLSLATLVCRNIRGVFFVLLPSLVIGVPAFSAGDRFGRLYEDMLPGEPLPGLTVIALGTAKLFWTYLPISLPLAFLILALPTCYHAWQLQARGELEFSSLALEEMHGAKRLLLMGIVLYPLLGYVCAMAFFAPLVKLIDKLGG